MQHGICVAAVIEPIVEPDPGAVHVACADAALVFLPLRLAGMRVADPFGDSIDALLAELPIVALVAAARDLQIDDADDEPVDGGDADSPAPDDVR